MMEDIDSVDIDRMCSEVEVQTITVRSSGRAAVDCGGPIAHMGVEGPYWVIAT